MSGAMPGPVVALILGALAAPILIVAVNVFGLIYVIIILFRKRK